MNRHNYPATVTAASEMPHMPHVGPVFDPKRFVTLRARMMLLVALCAAIPTVTAAWFLVPAGYTASAQIQIKSTEPYVLNADTAATPYAQFVSTQISLITSGAVLEKVLDSAAISNIPTLARLEGFSDRVEYLKGAISARTRQGSEFVDVTCSMPEKDDARQVLQEVITVYLNYVHRESADTGRERLAMLTTERDNRQLELETQLKTIREMQSTMGVPMVGETPLETGEAELYRQKLSEAEESFAAAEKGLTRMQMDIDSIDAMIAAVANNQPIYEFQIEERVGNDVRVRTLRESVATMEADLSSTADRVKEPLPQRSMDMAKVSSLKEKLTTVEPEVRKELLLSTKAQFTQEQKHIEENVKQAQADIERFKTQVESYQGRLSSTSDQYVALEDLKSKAEETRRTLEEVRSNIATISLESNAPSRVRLNSDASVPGGGPDYMNRFMAMVMAFAASVGLALGLGVWRELADQQIRSSQDLARLTLLPIIATVPHAQEDELPQPFDLTHIISERPLCAISDAYRHVLARLLYSYARNGGMKSLAVVSASRGDGKSSLTTNLGIALAQAERSVLLIDASYRRPTLETSLGLQRAVGLVEVLEEQVALKQAIRFTSVHGLFVLGPGLDCERLAGTLASRRIAVLLEYAAEKFDYVIVDTPPWLIMSDTKLITPLVDGVIMVVGTATTTLGMVRRCLRELDEVKANVLGLVLNGVRPTFGGYMQKNKELYYGYAHELPTNDDKAVAVALGVPDRNPGASGTDD